MTENKGIKLSFRLTESEHKTLMSKFEKSHMGNLSNYIRKMILNGYTIYVDMTEIKGSVTQLKRIGTSLNQIAKAVNSTGNIYASEIEIIKREMEEIWKTVKTILETVSRLT